MHSTPDSGPDALGPDAATAAPTTFLDPRGLGFTEQDPRPYSAHTTFRYDNDDRAVIVVYCHPDDLTEPGDDGACDLRGRLLRPSGHRDLWQTTISHLDASPLTLACCAPPSATTSNAAAAGHRQRPASPNTFLLASPRRGRTQPALI